MTNFDIENLFPGKIITGVDEAGRGCLAGPVVASAVILNRSFDCSGFIDSKKLNVIQREHLYEEISKNHFFSFALATVEEIDSINIREASILAMKRAISKVKKYDIALIDGNYSGDIKNSECIIKGDDKSHSIAAASIVAKHLRDQIMTLLDDEFPGYDLANNKGYGTAKHLIALKRLGIQQFHRRTFAPIKRIQSQFELDYS